MSNANARRVQRSCVDVGLEQEWEAGDGAARESDITLATTVPSTMPSSFLSISMNSQ